MTMRTETKQDKTTKPAIKKNYVNLAGNKQYCQRCVTIATRQLEIKFNHVIKDVLCAVMVNGS